MALRPVYHLRFKTLTAPAVINGEQYYRLDESEEYYYGSIKALITLNKKTDLGVGIDTLYRHAWTEAPYENKLIIIKKGILEVPAREKKKIKK